MAVRVFAVIHLYLFVWCGLVAAQAWPTRPITMIAPSSPGSTPDITARVLAQKLGELLGQQVVVTNRTGAAGNIGSEAVAKATPDGYTILLGSIANTTSPHLMKSVGYSLDDLAPVSSVAAAPDILTVHPSVPAKNVKELLEWIKAQSGTPIGIPGLGSTPHLSAETLRMMTGVPLTIVPHQGGGALLQAVLSAQVPVVFLTTVSVIPRLKSGQLRGLGITSAARSASLPDLPTLAEAGLPGFEVTAWFGVFAPAKTPTAIVDRLSEETRRALSSPDLRSRLIELGAEPLGSTPAAFGSFVRGEYAKWGKLIREANIKSE